MSHSCILYFNTWSRLKPGWKVERKTQPGHDMYPTSADNLAAHLSTWIERQPNGTESFWAESNFELNLFHYIFGQINEIFNLPILSASFLVPFVLFHDQMAGQTCQLTNALTYKAFIAVGYLFTDHWWILPASGSSPPKLSRVGANSKAAAQDEDEEETENSQCKPALQGGNMSQTAFRKRFLQ